MTRRTKEKILAVALYFAMIGTIALLAYWAVESFKEDIPSNVRTR